MAWLLAQTLPLCEFRVRDRLRETPAIEVYVPTYKRLIFPRHTRKPRIVPYPLFARYLFIWIEQLGAEVESIRARTRLVWPVRAEERRYIFVPEPDVADLRARVASGEFDALAGLERRLLTVGDTVLVTQGQFVGHEGVVTEVGRHRRLRVALQNCMLVAGVEQLELSH